MREPMFDGPGSIRRAIKDLAIAIVIFALPFITIAIAYGFGH